MHSTLYLRKANDDSDWTVQVGMTKLLHTGRQCGAKEGMSDVRMVT